MTHEAFEHIVHELRPKLINLAYQFFSDHGTAEDIAQEALMRLWMVRERIDLQIGIEPLAIRMAKNLCVSEWRKQQVRVHVTPKDTSCEDVATRQLETDDDIQRLKAAIGKLKPAEQRLFRMRHEMEMELSEISAVTGIGTRSVSAMLSTAKRKLLEMLSKKGSNI